MGFRGLGFRGLRVYGSGFMYTALVQGFADIKPAVLQSLGYLLWLRRNVLAAYFLNPPRFRAGRPQSRLTSLEVRGGKA